MALANDASIVQSYACSRPTHTRSATPVDEHVGLMIKLRRLELDMSQERLAHQLGITAQQLQKYERGANRVGAGRLHEIANILGVKVQHFFQNLPSVEPDQQNITGKPTKNLTSALEDAATVKLLCMFASVRDPGLKNRVVSLVEAVIVQD